MKSDDGFSLIEVMLAMVIVAFTVLGVMSAFEWSDRGVVQGVNGTRALALVEARLEAKRAAPWSALLVDDLNGDGEPEITMRDDGQPPDDRAGDGVYTALAYVDGITLRWTVQPNRSAWQESGSAIIRASARYPVGREQWRDVTMATIRANPRYLGAR